MSLALSGNVPTWEQAMTDPFQVEICHRDGRVVVIARITEKLTETSFLGEVIRDDIPQDMSALLQEYHEACESGSLVYFEVVLQKVQELELRVVGIPGREMGGRVRDFQLGPDGLFSLKID